MRSALKRIDKYRDVVDEFARQIDEMQTWVQGFICIVYFFGQAAIGKRGVEVSFEELSRKKVFGGDGFESARMATEVLGGLVVEQAVYDEVHLRFRHPSVEEGFDRVVRSEPRTREVVRRFVVSVAGSEDDEIVLAAYRCFARYADILGDSEFRAQFFHRFGTSSSARIREESKRVIMVEFNSFGESLRVYLIKQVRDTWAQRARAQFLLLSGVDIETGSKIAHDFGETWDDWVRFYVADNLRAFLERYRPAIPQWLTACVLNGNSVVRRVANQNAKKYLSEAQSDATYAGKLRPLLLD